MNRQSITRIIAIACITTSITTGCSDNTSGVLLDDYLTRVARVQDADKVPKQADGNTQLPRKRDLKIEIPTISIGLLDSYQLRQCNLFNLIAERNSVLGKVADEFSNFDYQRALLKGIEQCLQSEEIEPELRNTLAQILQQKSSQLAMHRWNLVYSSETMQKQLTGNQWLSQDMSHAFAQVNQALSVISHATMDSQVKVFDVQEVLDKTAIIGDLNYSLANAAIRLNRVTQQLSEYDALIICGKNRDTTKFKYLNNVFEQQYIGKVQPYMAELDSYYQALLPNLAIFTPQPDIHPYEYPLQDNYLAFHQAIRQHVDYWQQLFKRCGRKVG